MYIVLAPGGYCCRSGHIITYIGNMTIHAIANLWSLLPAWGKTQQELLQGASACARAVVTLTLPPQPRQAITALTECIGAIVAHNRDTAKNESKVSVN